MQVAELELRASVQVVRLGRTTYRVVRPTAPLAGWLVERLVCWSGVDGALDKHSLRALTIAWAFAARSPRTITFLPISSDGPESTAHALDLVLVHHSLQLPASRWRSVRRRLGPGHPETITLPARAYDGHEEPDWSHRRADRDRFTRTVAAGSLVLAGSRPAFERDLRQLVAMVEQGPAERAAFPNRHLCVELADRWIHVEQVGRREAKLGAAAR